MDSEVKISNESTFYKILNLEDEDYRLVHSEILEDGQCCPALSANGKLLYAFNKGDYGFSLSQFMESFP